MKKEVICPHCKEKTVYVRRESNIFVEHKLKDNGVVGTGELNKDSLLCDGEVSVYCSSCGLDSYNGSEFDEILQSVENYLRNNDPSIEI